MRTVRSERCFRELLLEPLPLQISTPPRNLLPQRVTASPPPLGGGRQGDIARVFQGKPWYPPLMQANRTQVQRHVPLALQYIRRIYTQCMPHLCPRIHPTEAPLTRRGAWGGGGAERASKPTDAGHQSRRRRDNATEKKGAQVRGALNRAPGAATGLHGAVCLRVTVEPSRYTYVRCGCAGGAREGGTPAWGIGVSRSVCVGGGGIQKPAGGCDRQVGWAGMAASVG